MDIPDTINGLPVTGIGSIAFAYYSGLTSVTIPNSITSIGEDAFTFCTRLTRVAIPGSVTNIGTHAFANCTGLTAITVDAQNPFYSSVGQVLFDKSQTTLIQYPGGRSGSYTIPDSVTSIGNLAFSSCSALISVTIPNSVTNIGQDAFVACGSLTSVTIPGSVTSTGEYAFLGCNALTNVTIANGVTSIGSGAFGQCTSLMSVTIPGSVTNIGDGAFSYCYSLASVTIPGSVASILNGAFASCNSLTAVYFRGNAPTYNPRVFVPGYNKATVVYYLPGTTGWGSIFDGVPAMLWKPKIQTSDSSFGVRMNQFGFTITWASGMVVVPEACTNLATPVWISLQTNTLSADSLYFSDFQWTNYPSRFYRIRSP